MKTCVNNPFPNILNSKTCKSINYLFHDLTHLLIFSHPKHPFWGGPQGTLLGLFLFLILINDCGFSNNEEFIGEKISKKKGKFSSPSLHTKFVDDMTILEAINVKEAVIPNPEIMR